MWLYGKKNYDFAQRWSEAFRADDAQAAPLAEAYLREYFAEYPHAKENELPKELEQEDPDDFQKRLGEINSSSDLRAAAQIQCGVLARMETPLSPEENRQWCCRLARILERTAFLCSENLFPFQGTPQSMRLCSQQDLFVNQLFFWEETHQVLTVDRAGHAALCARRRGGEIPARMRTYTLDPAAAQNLLEQVAAWVSVEQEETLVLDAGYWELELTNTEGKAYRFRGDLYEGIDGAQTRLSALIRKTLGTDSLFAFDESWRPEDEISRLTLEYRVPDKDSQPGERLILDCDAGTIERIDQRHAYGDSSHRYFLQDSLRWTLRHFGYRSLFQQPEIPAGELIQAFGTIPLYTLTVEFADGTRQVLTGHYERSELPEHFGELLKAVTAQMRWMDSGGILDPEAFGRARPRQGQRIYCSVSFPGGSKTYYYRTEDDSLRVGDEVVVPAGKDNRPALVTIEEVEYFAPEAVPLPEEQTKWILRRATAQDLNPE